MEAGCEACRTGHFTAEEGETSCETCPSGYIAQSEGQSARTPCASGWYGTAFACEECPPGEYALCARCSVGTIAVLTRSLACDACPAGQYGSNASATACETCDVGTFTDSAGASACTICGDHDDTGSTLWTTVGQRERGGQLQWVDVDGSSSVTSCTCVEGARQSEHGACVPCGEGLICPLFGSVQLQPGYFAAAEDLGSVWRCHGVDPGRCPGGAPGLCARLRDNSSIACGDCEPNTRWTTDGPCETCQPSDVSVLLVAFLVAAVSLLCLYCVVVNENRARNNDHVVLLATLGSQLVTVLQMMGVCKLLSVTWPKPFSTILTLTSLLNLKLEILNVGCVVGMSVVTRYAGTAFGFMVLLAVMCLFHMVHMGVFHSHEMLAGKWKTYRLALVGGLGSIFMLCYIVVVATICAPLRCESHPNGQSTLVDYPQVVCLSSTDHQDMLVLGGMASCIPIGFLSMACVVLHMLPKFLAKGDTAFLHAFSFLFFRFQPGAFWYALVLLARNTGMALAPALHEETLQLFVSVLILLPCTVISSVSLPWRAHLANLLDVGTNGSFVLVVFLGALFKDVDDKTLIGDLLLVILGLLGLMFLIASCICVNMFCIKRRRRKYEFFLCHHKEGSGAFCRLLKMFLQDNARQGSQIFSIQITCKISAGSSALWQTGFAHLLFCVRRRLCSGLGASVRCALPVRTRLTRYCCASRILCGLLTPSSNGMRNMSRESTHWRPMASVSVWFERHFIGCARVRGFSCLVAPHVLP